MNSSSAGRPAYPRATPPAASSIRIRPPARGERAQPPPAPRDPSPSARHRDYHDGGAPAPSRDEWRGIAIRLAPLAIALLASCTSVTTRLPQVTFDTEPGQPATKMLRPGARASACRTALPGMPVPRPASPLAAALPPLLALGP